MTMPRCLLGIDPGLNITGYGVLEVDGGRPRILEAGILRGNSRLGPTELPQRLRELYEGLMELLRQWSPGIMAIEQLYAHEEHPRAALQMSHIRGCYLLAAAQQNVDVQSYAPTRIKKTVTGSGRATKEQMQAAIMRELGLSVCPQPHDVADALGVALCAAYQTQKNLASGTRRLLIQGVRLEAFQAQSPDDRTPLQDRPGITGEPPCSPG